MLGDQLDETLLLQLDERLAGERATDLQTFGDDGRGDQLVAGDFLQKLVIGSLIKENQVVQLVSDLSLRPLLQNSNKMEKRVRRLPLCIRRSVYLLLGFTASSFFLLGSFVGFSTLVWLFGRLQKNNTSRLENGCHAYTL